MNITLLLQSLDIGFVDAFLIAVNACAGNELINAGGDTQPFLGQPRNCRASFKRLLKISLRDRGVFITTIVVVMRDYRY